MDRISTEEASLLIGCSTARIRQLVGEKKLKPVGKVGQTYMFRRDVIERYKERKTNGKK